MHWVGGGTMAHYCITACFEVCSTFSYQKSQDARQLFSDDDDKEEKTKQIKLRKLTYEEDAEEENVETGEGSPHSL